MLVRICVPTRFASRRIHNNTMTPAAAAATRLTIYYTTIRFYDKSR